MAKGEAYYIGPGVFHFGGVDYGYGKKLPADVPAATIEAMKVKGKVSDTPPAKVGAPGMGELGTLRDKVQELTLALNASKEEAGEAGEAATRNAEEIERLQEKLTDVTNERDAARNSIIDLNKTIEDLTKQLMNPAPAAPVSEGEGAGPAKVGKK